MELFTIALINVEESYVRSLSAQIHQALQHLHIVQNGFKATFTWNDKRSFIYVEAEAGSVNNDPHTHEDRVRACLADVLATHIVADKESGILRMLIEKVFKYEKTADIDAIEGYCKQSLIQESQLDGSPLMTSSPSRQRRIQMLKDQLITLLEEKHQLSLNGFLKFRLQEYKEELREIAEYAIDEFIMDRQYQEFISLLQYFVYIQEAKIPVAHLIHKGGHEFIILNDKMELIDANEFDASFRMEMLEKDINLEDMIVSTLITVSPANIYIHTRDPELTIIKTIRQIFEDRTTVCSYCRTCDLYLGDAKKQDQLSP
ncbi:putative sporulation protein YtxC [Paenibacillus roseipurpureus]|uniref:Sporulation protein YtxC n=1 Tax=Paenibacillus roseopurpureus TaxID=2918901 RepID=A0AA96LLZ5_9BACL|nr:putative sporulation protein YtxC [Paenibacillus sp. MBLB1832]WNR43561.1 putative sporulation protein YtxC [Paenibacillus sp. MBLB1832]